jgi:hypothetical protein
MSAFTKSGHSKAVKSANLTGCFRPEADKKTATGGGVDQSDLFERDWR